MTAPGASPAGGFRTFVTVWLGQAISLLGSRVSRLALGVWLFQKTGEVTDFVLIALCDALPILVLMPFTGPGVPIVVASLACLIGARRSS